MSASFAMSIIRFVPGDFQMDLSRNYTFISRLVWLLASPVGGARSLAEVERAVHFHKSSCYVGAKGTDT
jgi:hypothetical protein